MINSSFPARVAWEVRLVDWADLTSATGSAEGIADALVALAASTDEVEAARAYWGLDNRVVVQNRLFSSAWPAIRFMFRILVHGSTVAQRHALDLLIQVASGEGPHDDIGLMNRCLEEIRRGLELIYSRLGDPDPAIRHRAAWLIALTEPDWDRLKQYLSNAEIVESDASVRDLFYRILREGPEVWSVAASK